MKTSKASILLCAVLAFGWAAPSYAQTVPPAPRLWLGFDNTLTDKGTSTNTHIVALNNSGSAGFANDVVNATAGTASENLPGDGSYVNVDSVSDLNFNTGNPFTITAWIKPTTSGGVIAAKSLSTAFSGTHTLALFLQSDGPVRMDIYYVGSVHTFQTVTNGVWTHVAATYDGTTTRMFINGVLDNSGNLALANEEANQEGPWSFTVGATLNPFFPADNGAGDPFNGKIDEVGVWDKALSTDQIASVYSSGVPAVTVDITQEPLGAIRFAGQTATFSVTAAPVGTPGPLHYQWQSNGVDLVSETNATYTTPPLSASAAYHCNFTAGPATVVSADAFVTVITPALPPTPVLWLPFNSSLADLGTSTLVHNVSGQPNPGYTGSFSPDVANATGGAASLSLAGDGSFIEVTNVSDLNFDTGSPYTITAWIKTTTPGGVIAAKSTPAVITGSGGTLTPAFFVDESGSLRMDVFYVSTVLSSATVTSGRWTHVAATYDGTTYRLYINGFPDGVGAFAGANEGANGEGPWAFTVGATLNGTFPQPNGVPGAPFTGGIDEVAVWGAALGPNQIASVYLNGIPKASINITQQPVGATVLAGQTAAFSVTAAALGTADPLHYQWQSNGVAIVTATNATYTTPPLAASADGAVYHCNLTAGSLAVLSADAIVHVITPALPPPPVLWLPFNGDLTDHGTSTNVHHVSGESLGPLIAGAANPIALIETNMTYDGTFTNNVANASCGSGSLSLTADGSYILVTNVSDLNFDTGHPFTISAWINLGGGLASGFICGKSPMSPDTSIDPNGAQAAFSMGAFGDVNPTHGQVNAGVFYVDEGETTQTVTNGWTHVAVTYNGNSSWVMYVNGFQDSTFGGGACNEAATVGTTGPWPFVIGYAGNTVYPLPLSASGPYGLDYTTYDGEIDEVAVWTSALSAGQIYSVYRQGVVPPTLPTLHVAKSGGQAALTWTGTGYKLQQNSSLTNPAGWSDVAGGSTSPVTVTIGAGAEFFRLATQ